MKQYIDLDGMVNANSAYVLSIIQKSGGISRKQISQLSGLSWGGMTKIVNRLLENGYIVEEKGTDPAAAGRTPHVLRINTAKNFIVGLDINKTGFRAIVMDLAGNVLDSFSLSTQAKTAQELLGECTAFLASILRQYEPGAIVAAGIAMQGIVDAQNGISVRFPGIADWKNVPLKEIWESQFQISVYIEHDPDCLLYPHLSPESSENVLLLRIDRSIGAAVSLAGKVFKGTGILEIAHNIVIPMGKQCACGARGCLEAYISPCLKDDTVDTQAIAEIALPLAAAVKNLSTVFCADKVILTGALIRHRHFFDQALSAYLEELQCHCEVTFLEKCDSAAPGAAMIAAARWIDALKI